MRNKDYYRILGVGKIADEMEIEWAFLPLTRQHPWGKNPGEAQPKASWDDTGKAQRNPSAPFLSQLHARLGVKFTLKATSWPAVVGLVVQAISLRWQRPWSALLCFPQKGGSASLSVRPGFNRTVCQLAPAIWQESTLSEEASLC